MPSRDSWEHFDSESWESSDFDSFESSDSNILGRSANINHRTPDLTSRRNVGLDIWESSDSEISDSSNSNNLKKYAYHSYDSDDKSDKDDSGSWEWDSNEESNEVRKKSVTSDLYDSGSWEDSDSDSSDWRQVTDGSRHVIKINKRKYKSFDSDSIDSDSYDSDEELNVLKIGSRKRWRDQRLSRNPEFGETEIDEPAVSIKHTIIKQQSNRKRKFRDDDSFDMDSDVSDRRNDRTDKLVTQNVMKRNRENNKKDRFNWNSESSDDGNDSNKWGKQTNLKQRSESDDEDDSFDWDSDSDFWTKPNKIRWSKKVNTVEENNRFDFNSDIGNTKRDDSVDLIKQSSLIRIKNNGNIRRNNKRVDMDSDNINDNSNNELYPIISQESNKEYKEIEDNNSNNRLNAINRQEPNDGHKDIGNHNANRGVINIVLPHLNIPKRNGDNDMFFRNKKMNLFEKESEERGNDKRQIIQKRPNFLHSRNNNSLVRASKLGKFMFPNLGRNEGEENEIEDD